MNKMPSISYDMSDEVKEKALNLEANAKAHVKTLLAKTMPFTGWVGYAGAVKEDFLREIENTATEIAGKCKYLVVIGIGGSYLGAKAALSFIDSPASKKQGSFPEVVFAGFNISGSYHKKLLDKIKNDDICLLIISKSGGTLEPSLAFAMLKQLLIEKYGRDEALSRIYAITDATSGKLKEESDKNGYKTFVLPSDIGGRYSVLSPVGLLPIAAAGIDIRGMLNGAYSAESGELMEAAIKLACIRATLEKEKCVEIIASFEPSLDDFAGWAQQLYGESEGKEGHGALPVSISISKDLHSLGQYLQEGKQMFYETILFIDNPSFDITIAGEEAGSYENRSYSEFNKAALVGMSSAHKQVGIPIIRIDIPDATAYSFGQMVYFAEMACAITGMLIGVNPFDQPGVEAYKKAMYEYLDKA